MKVKALAQYCKKTKYITLLDDVDSQGAVKRQYIHTGTALFPLDGLPLLNEETLLAILDVPQDERSEWEVRRGTTDAIGFYTEDNNDNDKVAELIGLDFWAGGYSVQPFYTPYGMVTIDADTRRVIADSKKTAEYFARKHGDNVTIIAKNGFMLIAAITPIRRWATEQISMYLSDVSALAEKLERINTAEDDQSENVADGKSDPLDDETEDEE